jgi:hypothetical protein
VTVDKQTSSLRTNEKKEGIILDDQTPQPKGLSLTGITGMISAVTAAAFVASSLHVYGLELALGRPLQQFFEPLD